MEAKNIHWRFLSSTIPESETFFLFSGETNGTLIGQLKGLDNAKIASAAPELLSKLKEALEAIEWYMDNTTPLYNDWQTFHDLGMNIRMSGEELTLKTE